MAPLMARTVGFAAIVFIPAAALSDTLEPAPDARIGLVRVDAKPIFDSSESGADNWVFRLANRLHFRTREQTIADQLLFHSGDPYDGRLLDESARLLRQNHYLRDASIRPVAYRDGVVDVEVQTQDVWTFNPGFSFGRRGGKSTFGFELEELNLFGSGAGLGVGFKSGLDRDVKQIFYRDHQLGSSRWDLSTAFSDNSDGRQAELSLELPFFALDSRRASGIRISDDQRIDSRYDLGQVVDSYRTQEKHAEVYWGRSRGLIDGWARRLSYGFTFDENRFAPAAGATALHGLPADRKLVYPWIASEWVQDRFVTDRNLDQIGRTEDHANGWRVHARLGIASSVLGSDRNALLVAAAVSDGIEIGAKQKLQFSAELSSRIESGAIAGGVLEAAARYHWRQSPKRVVFASLSAAASSGLDADQQILLGGDNGLRGYPLRYQSGTGRWLFTAEQRWFTDWYPMQLFRVGAAAFVDVGGTWGQGRLGSRSQGTLKDVGIGLRLGNDRSARGSVLHVDLAFPLDGDPAIRGVQFLIETKHRF
jgi:outer membrane translocation and assembly module TamA